MGTADAPAHMRIERVTRRFATRQGPYRGTLAQEHVLTLRWRTQPYRAGVLSLAAYAGGLATVALVASGHFQPGCWAAVLAGASAYGVIGARRHVEVSPSGITVFTPVGGGSPQAVATRGLLGLAIEEHGAGLGRYRVVAQLRDRASAVLFDTLRRAEAEAAVDAIQAFLGLDPLAMNRY